MAGPAHEIRRMTAQQLVGLLEEMMDLKSQTAAEIHLKTTPEVTRLLQEKRETRPAEAGADTQGARRSLGDVTRQWSRKWAQRRRGSRMDERESLG